MDATLATGSFANAILAGGLAFKSGLKLRVPDPSWFSRGRRVDFSGREDKIPTLPSDGRVGHPENLNRYMGAAVLWCHHPLARFIQLKT
jgi:hypothetical protein